MLLLIVMVMMLKCVVEVLRRQIKYIQCCGGRNEGKRRCNCTGYHLLITQIMSTYVRKDSLVVELKNFELYTHTHTHANSILVLHNSTQCWYLKFCFRDRNYLTTEKRKSKVVFLNVDVCFVVSDFPSFFCLLIN